MVRDGSVIESHDFFLMHLEELIQHMCVSIVAIVHVFLLDTEMISMNSIEHIIFHAEL